MRSLFLLLFIVFSTTQITAQVGDLIWEENFDDLENWIIETGNGNWGWGNGELQYYSPNNVSISEIDSVEYDLFTDPFGLGEEAEEFLEPFYFIVNLAVGGTLTDAYQLGDPGSGEQVSMPFPAEMFVDYIRVYEWNEQGNVQLGPPTPKTETYGIYTDSTETKESMFVDNPGNIWVWEGTLIGGSIEPFEGENVLSWRTNNKGWFGAGVQSVQPLNLLDFSEGNLHFSIKIPANVSFQIGVIDAWGNQNYVDFPANQTAYGLERNGEWGHPSIPISDLRGIYIDLRMLSYEFVILEVNGANAEFAIDNIFYENGLINSNERHDVDSELAGFELYNNYPNPFNPVTNIQYQIPSSSNVELSIYNLQGQKVATLVNSIQTAGSHLVQWDASGYSSGIYFYRITTETGFTETKSLVLLK